MMFTGDPVADFHRHDAEMERLQQERLESLPVCEYCNRRIAEDDDLWDIEGYLFHDECAKKLFMKKVEFYVG